MSIPALVRRAPGWRAGEPAAEVAEMRSLRGNLAEAEKKLQARQASAAF